MSTCIIRKVNYAFLFTIFCCFYCVPSFYLLSSFEYITQLKRWAVCLKWSTNIQQQKFALSRDCLWCPYNSFVTFVKMNQFKKLLAYFFFAQWNGVKDNREKWNLFQKFKIIIMYPPGFFLNSRLLEQPVQ